MINSSPSLSVASSTDLIDAKLEEHQLCGSKQCPGCGHRFEAKPPDWMGLPAGVKFDPTDQELIEHLEAKVEARDSIKSHPLIDEFIPTIEGEDGICYTHPEKFPGVTRDGLSRHFFHRPSKAYTTGTRKRRKIQNDECDLQSGETRWHKTGKTRPVMVNGKQKGCKKILVLYTNFGKNRKPEKTNWVMHQYHLGQHEEEKEGELVVSKIFFQTQPRQSNWSDRIQAAATVTNQCSSEPKSRRDHSGNESGSSKEILMFHQRDEMSGVGVPPLSSYAALDIHQQLKSDHFSFAPYSKSFDEVGIGDSSTTREVSASASASASGEANGPHSVAHEQYLHQQQHKRHHVATDSSFHIRRPMHPISTVISPSSIQASIVFDENSYNASRVLLQNENNFQQQHQQHQHHHKLGVGRSASGLDELIMGCTTSDLKEENSLSNPQESDWLKYSSYWPDPENPNFH